MKLAVIPARGGSKRIPRKNIKSFCGKPMIARSIEAARQSQLFDRIIVSTDDDEIAQVAQAWGAEVPFRRPSELANDHAGTIEVIAHATQWAQSQWSDLEAVCCIYATAPFIQPADLHNAHAMLAEGDWDFCFTATEYPSPIYRSFRQNNEGGVEMLFPEHFETRSQDLPQAYHDAGQFYWGRPEAWRDHQRLFSERSSPLVIPRWRVQDIDTPDDWHRAELIAQAIRTMEAQ